MGDDGMKSKCCACMGVVIALISIIMFACSWATLQPTQLGLLSNGITGTVDTSRTYTAGRYFVWLRHSFIVFPGNQVTMQLSSNSSADAPPVAARTGRDHSQKDSGGQPVNISLSFQYQFAPESIPFLYQAFGSSYKQRFISYTRQAVTNAAQGFTPHDFWTERPRVVEAMRQKLNESLYQNARATVLAVQLLRVQFAAKYEQSIINTALQVQLTSTTTYHQKVVDELKGLDVLRAVNSANVTEIAAAAAATATLINNKATASGFKTVQKQKAESYRLLRDSLGMTNEQLVAFLKLQALKAHTASASGAASVVVGMQSPVGA